MSDDLKRYKLVRGDPGYRDQMCVRPDGAWVRHDDAAARIAALEAEVARLKLFIASDVSRAVGLLDSLLPGPLSHDDTHEAYLRRMSALFTAEAEKLAAGVSAALPPPPEGETP